VPPGADETRTLRSSSRPAAHNRLWTQVADGHRRRAPPASLPICDALEPDSYRRGNKPRDRVLGRRECSLLRNQVRVICEVLDIDLDRQTAGIDTVDLDDSRPSASRSSRPGRSSCCCSGRRGPRSGSRGRTRTLRPRRSGRARQLRAGLRGLLQPVARAADTLPGRWGFAVSRAHGSV